MTGDGKMGIFNSVAAFLSHKDAGSVVKDKISELPPLSLFTGFVMLYDGYIIFKFKTWLMTIPRNWPKV